MRVRTWNLKAFGKVVVSILEKTTLHGAVEGKTQTRSVKYYNIDGLMTETFVNQNEGMKACV